ncbi:hypothetical protein [Streptomyces sp. NRRL S-646]|uniref:hypothetical protein n=1 Tax=Streptomyces sp. NRRL S-646 TaxID=1463917 RepID=UPI000A47440D|nr:hypothetical protein [Streptomyces sp. NRRL S-646]
MRQRVSGLPPTGPRCFGYTAECAELVEDEAAEVKDCFHALLAGAALSGMAADLNERGILNCNGTAAWPALRARRGRGCRWSRSPR